MINIDELKGAIEGILYVAEEPVTLEDLEKTFPENSVEDIKNALNLLIRNYSSNIKGMEIREVAGGYQMSSKLKYHDYIRHFLKTRPGFRLSMAALETLAIIAYRQPITVPEILQIRGVKSTGAIKTLIEKKLIIAKGRKKTVGSPMLYGTSKQFLIHFGLNSLKDLPSIEELEELFSESEQPSQQKMLFETKEDGITKFLEGRNPLFRSSEKGGV